MTDPITQRAKEYLAGFRIYQTEPTWEAIELAYASGMRAGEERIATLDAQVEHHASVIQRQKERISELEAKVAEYPL